MKSIREIMTSNVEFCTPKDNVFEVAVKMKELNVGAIPICDDDKNLLGMITDRDIVLRGIAEKRSGSYAVTNVMSEDLYTITADKSIDEAAKIMSEKQIRRIPVVENGKLIGIVSLGDLAVEKLSDEKAGHALSDISEPGQIQQ